MNHTDTLTAKKLKYATWKLSDEQTRTTHGISFFCWYGQDGARESRDGVSFALNSGPHSPSHSLSSATEWSVSSERSATDGNDRSQDGRTLQIECTRA